MSSPSQIESMLHEASSAHIFSGFQLYYERGAEAISYAGGVTSYWPQSNIVDESTRFDIGSITKTVVTTSLLAVAADRGEISLEATLGDFLPELSPPDLKTILLRDLLAHCSGLEGWLPLFQEVEGRNLLSWFASHPERARPRKAREKVVYSDLGFLLLGKVLEIHHGSLSVAFRTRVAEPLKLAGVGFGPLGDQGNVAATEYSLSRHRLLQGEVFDENSDALGGETGHAGLFATARGLAPWCREWLGALNGQSRWLRQVTAKSFTSPSRLVESSTWALGWDTKSPAGSTAGAIFSERSFGSLGYPGCSIWVDPEVEGFVLLFTNRVHPSRFDERIRQFRPRLHDAIAQYWRK